MVRIRPLTFKLRDAHLEGNKATEWITEADPVRYLAVTQSSYT